MNGGARKLQGLTGTTEQTNNPVRNSGNLVLFGAELDHLSFSHASERLPRSFLSVLLCKVTGQKNCQIKSWAGWTSNTNTNSNNHRSMHSSIPGSSAGLPLYPGSTGTRVPEFGLRIAPNNSVHNPKCVNCNRNLVPNLVP